MGEEELYKQKQNIIKQDIYHMLNGEKKKYKPEDWAEFQQEIDDETAAIEAERQRIQWGQDELAKKQAEMDEAERAEAERRRIALEEEAERLRKLEEERRRKQDEIEREKEKLRQ